MHIAQIQISISFLINDTEKANEQRMVGYQILKLLAPIAKFLWPEINKNKNVKTTKRDRLIEKEKERTGVIERK